jgi:hypothetical protein
LISAYFNPLAVVTYLDWSILAGLLVSIDFEHPIRKRNPKTDISANFMNTPLFCTAGNISDNLNTGNNQFKNRISPGTNYRLNYIE